MSRPHTRQPDSPSIEIVAWEIFESYVKKCLRNHARTLRRRILRSIDKEPLTVDLEEHFATIDHYPSEDYQIIIRGRSYSIHNAAVYRGLTRLSDKALEALVLHYWECWSDIEIASHFQVTPRTIRNWRSRSLEELRHTVRRTNDDEGDGCR